MLEDARAVYGDRRAALANDLTKMFERVDRGTLGDLVAIIDKQSLRGEYVLVIEGNTGEGVVEDEESGV